MILGTGLAGLRAAVEISIQTRGRPDIGIVSKVQVMRAHSVCAEGGTAAVMRPEEGDSLELHAWDTVKGSDSLADQDTVERFVKTSPDEIRLLEHWGVPWSRREDGRIMQWPLAGHCLPRACMAVDEGACKNLIKDRMERSGRRWTEAMAEDIVKLRAFYLSEDLDRYRSFHSHRDQKWLHPPGKWSVVEK